MYLLLVGLIPVETQALLQVRMNSLSLLTLSQAATIPIFSVSKLPQIWTNFKVLSFRPFVSGSTSSIRQRAAASWVWSQSPWCSCEFFSFSFFSVTGWSILSKGKRCSNRHYFEGSWWQHWYDSLFPFFADLLSLVLLGFVIGTVLNGIMLAQCVILPSAKKPKNA